MLVEADAVDQLVRVHVPRRRRVVVIAHDLDDASIYARSVAIGAEIVVTLPDDAHIVAKAIRDAFHCPQPDPSSSGGWDIRTVPATRSGGPDHVRRRP